MTGAVRSILETGSVQARVPVTNNGDPLDEAGVLMNRMLDRIEALISGLRGSLDNVAHDLRTPIARLRATAETALRAPQSPEEYRSALADCLEESERVVTILDALMDIAEAETGVMTLHTESIDLVPLVRSAVDLYSDVAEEKGVTIEIAGAEQLPVVADAVRLRQAIANLVDNAVKYTPSGGHVTVSTAAQPGGAMLVVADTGTGISAQDIPRIWDRLYRGDRSRSERGLGLGLSLVKAIIEAHHGSVAVESTPGRGSRFTVHVPNA
jgi:signal transduction histidine kinase